MRDVERRLFRFVLPIDSHRSSSNVMFRGPLFTYINEYTQARNHTLANIRVVARHLVTLVASRGIAARIQESAHISAKTQSVKRRLPAERRSRSTCERTIRHGSPIRRCKCPDSARLIIVLIHRSRKYNFKAKKQKVFDETADIELEESVRTISALFSQTTNANHTASGSAECSGSDEPLGSRVASISAEIAAAIAQASSQALDGEDEDGVEEEDGEGWGAGSGSDMGMAESIVPNTSGIRGDGGGRERGCTRGNGVGRKGIGCVEEDDEDSDTFPIPLRTRKGKDASVVGMKRKR
jgi:hypothetical protein